MINRDMICGAVCLDNGYMPGSREARVAQLASDLAVQFASALPQQSRQESERDYCRRMRKERRRAEKEMRRRVKEQTEAAIRANPQAYGFTGLELLILGWLISGIVSAICRKLFDLWWGTE